MPLTLKSHPTLRDLLLALFLSAAAALILYLAYKTWLSITLFSNQQTTITIALLLDGLGAALCTAGAIHLLDPSRQITHPRWYIRLPLHYALEIPRRLLLLTQIVSATLAVYAAYALFLNQKFPWPS